MNKYFETFLIKTQKYTGVDNVYFVKGGFWIFSEYVVTTLLNIILTILFARLITREVYGGYQFVLAVIGALAFFSLPGMNSAILRSVARGYEITLITATKTKIKWSILGSISLLLVALYIYITKPGAFVIYFVIAAAFFPLITSFDSYDSFLIGKKMFKKRSLFVISKNLLIIGGVILALVLTKNLLIILLSYFILNALMNINLYLKTTKYISKKKIDKGAKRYGKHLSLINIIVVISDYFDKIIGTYFLGLANIAIYSMANSISMQFKLSGQQTISSLIFPKLSVINTKNIKEKILKKCIVITLLSAIGIVIFYLLTPWIVKFFLTSKYESVIPYARVLFISLLFSYPEIVFQTYLVAKKKVKEIYLFNTFYAILKILLLIFLTYFFQIWGLVASILIIRYLGFFYLYYLFSKIKD